MLYVDCMLLDSVVIVHRGNKRSVHFFFFFFNDTATTEIYTLSLHDALPISLLSPSAGTRYAARSSCSSCPLFIDRKSTRLNSSHGYISYAVFCLKKKKSQRSWRHSKCSNAWRNYDLRSIASSAYAVPSCSRY